jgi:hypothetical protein
MVQPYTPLHYQQPSCLKEHLISMWIWMRERVDVEIRNHTTAIVAESNLLLVRDNIEKNKLKTLNEQEVLMTELRSKARACKQAPTKEMRLAKLKKLVPIMSRCKRYRQQTALASQQLSLLDMQINAFENGRFQKEMTDSLRASVVAMKRVGITDDASDVDTIVLDMEDTIAQQTQISEALSSSLVNSMDDNGSNDDSLMRELMMMMGDDDEDVEEVVTVVHPHATRVKPIVELPLVPVTIVSETSEIADAITEIVDEIAEPVSVEVGLSPQRS